MLHLRRLLPLLVLLGSFAGSLPVRADDDASHRAAADELLQAMKTERSIDHTIDLLSQSADRMVAPGRSSATPAEETAFRESLRQQARDIAKEQLNYQVLEPLFAQLYVASFTEAELKQLTEFYKSPAGQKLIEQQPDLAKKMAAMTQEKVRGTFPILTQKLRASVQKFREEHPMASPSPAPGASPATSVPAPTASASPSPSPTPIPPTADR